MEHNLHSNLSILILKKACTKTLHMHQRFYNKMIMNFEFKARMRKRLKNSIMDNNVDFCQIQKKSDEEANSEFLSTFQIQ